MILSGNVAQTAVNGSQAWPRKRFHVTLPLPFTVGRLCAKVARHCPWARSISSSAMRRSVERERSMPSASCHDVTRCAAGAMGSSIGSLVTRGGGRFPDDEVAPCAPLGNGVADCGALDPAGVVGVGGVVGPGCAQACEAMRKESEPA